MTSPPEPWTEARILRMVEEKIRESASLDYKRSDALARTSPAQLQLSKDVSSLANGGGGTLIYGVAEDVESHDPAFLDEGVDPKVISKEWLDDIITSSIHRKIDGVKIHVVDLSGERAGRVAYVIEVPQSMRAAHMASDHRYYKRYNFKSEPMEDYEVRDVSRRAESADLWVRPILLPFGDAARLPDVSELVPITIEVTNRSSAVALYGLIHVHIDARLQPSNGAGFQGQDESTILVDEKTHYPMRSFFASLGLPNGQPLWEGIRFTIGRLVVRVPREGDSIFHGQWVASSPNMTQRSRFFRLERREDTLKFVGEMYEGMMAT